MHVRCSIRPAHPHTARRQKAAGVGEDAGESRSMVEAYICWTSYFRGRVTQSGSNLFKWESIQQRIDHVFNTNLFLPRKSCVYLCTRLIRKRDDPPG